MTPAQRAALRALAKAATPGPWTAAGIHPSTLRGEGTPDVELEVHLEQPVYLWSVRRTQDRPDGSRVTTFIANAERCGNMSDEELEANGRFIAACSPEVIAALLDDLDAAERDVELMRGLPPKPTEWKVMEERIATLEARETRLREACERVAAAEAAYALDEVNINDRPESWALLDELRAAAVAARAALAEPDAQGEPR